MGGGGGGGVCAGMLSNDANVVGFTTFGGHDMRVGGGGGGLSILYPIDFWNKYPLSINFGGCSNVYVRYPRISCLNISYPVIFFTNIPYQF